MKGTSASKTLKISVYIFITIAIAMVVLGLGFMTSYYQLFYDGTSEMFDFYKSVQMFNKALFNGAIVILVMGIFMIGFDLNKGSSGLFGMIYGAVVSVYTVMTSMVILRATPYYRNMYISFDFSVIEGYEPSTLAFDLGLVLFGLGSVVSIVIVLSTILVYFQSRKLKEKTDEQS